jgi:hypothetical protein
LFGFLRLGTGGFVQVIRVIGGQRRNEAVTPEPLLTQSVLEADAPAFERAVDASSSATFDMVPLTLLQ